MYDPNQQARRALQLNPELVHTKPSRAAGRLTLAAVVLALALLALVLVTISVAHWSYQTKALICAVSACGLLAARFILYLAGRAG
jgi:hypothetical protein